VTDEKPWLRAEYVAPAHPRPGGWCDEAERLRAEATLRALLTAFGLHEAQARLAERPWKTRLESERTSVDRWALELWASQQLVQDTARALEELRAGPVLTPAKYERRWRAIIDHWNTTIENAGWLDLPPLCETCGLPVLARQSIRKRVTKRGVVRTRVALSRVCSDNCREKWKGRRRNKGG